MWSVIDVIEIHSSISTWEKQHMSKKMQGAPKFASFNSKPCVHVHLFPLQKCYQWSFAALVSSHSQLLHASTEKLRQQVKLYTNVQYVDLEKIHVSHKRIYRLNKHKIVVYKFIAILILPIFGIWYFCPPPAVCKWHIATKKK